MNIPNSDLHKKAFAALLYKQPGVKPFEAAMSLFPDTAQALYVSQHWPNDEVVLGEVSRLAGEEPDPNALPGKEELCREVWSWVVNNKGLTTLDERIKAAKLYAELQAMITKETGPSGPAMNVMLVRDHGDAITWEQRLLEQQNQLIADGERELASDLNASAV